MNNTNEYIKVAFSEVFYMVLHKEPVKFKAKLPDSLFVNLDIFPQKYCLDQWEFSSLKFSNKQKYTNQNTLVKF